MKNKSFTRQTIQTTGGKDYEKHKQHQEGKHSKEGEQSYEEVS